MLRIYEDVNSDEEKEFILYICNDLGENPDFTKEIVDSGYTGSIRKLSHNRCLKIGLPADKPAIPQSFQMCKNLCIPQKTYVSSSGRYAGSVLRYLNLCSLQQLIREGIRLAESEAAKITHDILNGLVELHKNGYVHRDFYPGNIMLDSQDGTITAVIIDFDELEQIGEDTRACFPYSGYHAPEVVLHNAVYDNKSEMFALGVILWELVLGKCAFGGYDFFGRVIENSWDVYVENQEYYNNLVKKAIAALPDCLKQTTVLSEICADFLHGLLNCSRENRLTAQEAIEHPFVRKVGTE